MKQVSRSISFAYDRPGFGGLRDLPALAFFERRVTYAVGVCVLSALAALTTLVAPRLLDPAAFGIFALLTSLFHYAGKSDLGLSQLADREIALQAGDSTERGTQIMRLLWTAGLIVIGVLVPVAMLIAYWLGAPPLATGLALAGGTFGMIAHGPASIHRAASRIWEFSVAALLLQAGLTLPRLAGLLVGGVTGSFLVLVAWFGALAFLFAPPRPQMLGKPGPPMLPLLRAALPLFAFNGLWLVYLTANRWISAYLAPPEQFGLFAFAASLSLVGIGFLGAAAQVRYPRMLSQLRALDARRGSAMLEREFLHVALVLVGIAVLACFVAPMGISMVFPRYEGATQATIALAVACVPLGVMAWTMPMAIVLSQSPGFDAMKLLVPATIILAFCMVIGHRYAGISGQAWGCVVGGALLLVSYTNFLRRLGSLTGKAMMRILLGQLVALIALTGLAMWLSPTAAFASTSAPAGWKLVFEEDFTSLRLWEGGEGEGIWEPHYPWASRTNETNSELQYYVDPRPGRDAPEIVALTPFSINEGILSIRGDVIPPEHRDKADGHEFSAGMLTTYRSRSFTYGYFEMRARIPAGRGLWPAFWLLPVEIAWPPEIDVMEVIGHEVDRLYVHLHTGQGEEQTKAGRAVPTPDLSRSFHTFAVKWTQEEVAWFFDGRKVFSEPTPPDMHQAKYLLVNLAIGGEWPGSPDEDTVFPADFEIDWIRVWQPEGAHRTEIVQ